MKTALVLIATLCAVIAVCRITNQSKSSARLSKTPVICLIICILIACFGSKKDVAERQSTEKKEAEKTGVIVGNKSHHQHPHTCDGYNHSFNDGYDFPYHLFDPPQLLPPAKKAHECYDCHGLKRCPWCAGNGRVEPDFGTLAWSEGRSIQCVNCNGRGICPTCGGSGVLYY